MLALEATFEKYEDDFLQWCHVKNRLHNRPDLHAFLLLDQLLPGEHDMVDWASHDEIGVHVTPEALAASATEEQVRDLVRCGVRLDDDNGLVMFV